ncbi:MAG: hypothetical protein LBC44_01480 [Mycoplasmataceae bacterium]|jgi:DNA polymerase III sliding clamp (beta) subunit (PCNA family)|nr:hypothetical protein [Mycoplasmataceae bacterium]
MKFTIIKNNLSELIKNISPFTGGSSLAFSDTILFNVDDSSLTVTVFNDTTSVKYKTDKFTFSNYGSFVINFNLLQSFISKFNDNDEISLSISDDSILRIQSKKSINDINLLDVKNFPEINFSFQQENKFSISTAFFRTINQKLLPLIRNIKTNSSPLSGVYFNTTRLQDTLEVFATDGFHLAYLKSSYSGLQTSFILNRDSIRGICSVLKDEKELECYVEKNSVIIKNNNVIYKCRIIEGVYQTAPAIKLFEENKSIYSLLIKKTDILNILERCLVLKATDDSPIISLEFYKNQLTVKCQSLEYGNTFDEIEVETNMEEKVSVRLNVNFLVDLIKNVKTESLLLNLASIEQGTKSLKIIFISEENNPSYNSFVILCRD